MADLGDDIEKYCRGELSGEEMHALERKALSDPFLADALEGAGSVVPDEFAGDISALEKELERRRKPAIPLFVWGGRIAAGLAVVGLATFTFLYNRSPDEKIATRKTETISADKLADSVAAPGNIASNEEVNPGRSRRPASVPSPPVEGPPKAEEVVIPEDLLAENEFLLPETAKPEIRRTKLVKGFVVDAEDGRALPGVNVTIKGSNVGTITDAEGNYQIEMDSLSLQDGLVFSYIGFESREMVPENLNDVSVALEPDISELSEVVVVGYGTRAPAEVEPTPVEMAEPDGGKKAYKQYLAENLRYPEQALNNKVEGKVTVQFTIESSGVVSDFRVVKGLGYGCEEEVIRLIQEGPKWQPTKRNHRPVTDKVKVKLKFSLPKKK